MLEIQRVVAHAPTKPSVLHHLRHRPCLLLTALLLSLSLIQAGRQDIAQPSTELTFLMPRDSPLLSAATAGYMGYLEKVRGKGVKHDHGPPRLARAMAILQYLCATPPPATIQHEEHLKLIEWTNDLAERNIMEACALVRQCYTADCYDVAGHPRLSRLHIHLDSVVMIKHKLMSMNQLLIRNLTGLSDQKEARACDHWPRTCITNADRRQGHGLLPYLRNERDLLANQRCCCNHTGSRGLQGNSSILVQQPCYQQLDHSSRDCIASHPA